MSDIEDTPPPPEPKPRGRPRKVIVEEAPPEPARRGRPKKVVAEEAPLEPPPPPLKKRTRKQRDPSELESKSVSFNTSRGERSFAARAPKKMQPEPPVEEAPPRAQPGPFHALHHRPVSARQNAMQNLMASW